MAGGYTEFQPKVAEVREKFLKKYDCNILDDTYDERDVEWVKESDALIRAVLNSFKIGGNVDKAVENLNKMLLFRAKWEINGLSSKRLNHNLPLIKFKNMYNSENNYLCVLQALVHFLLPTNSDLKEEDLHPELKQKNAIYYHGEDKEGRKILQFRVCKQKKGYLVNDGKKYIMFYMNQHYRQNPDKPIVTFYDFIDAGVGNMDMDVSKFVILLQGEIFPCISSYVLMFKMPPTIEVIWKILKGMLDSDQSKNTHFVKRTTIEQYMDKSYLMPHQQKAEKK